MGFIDDIVSDQVAPPWLQQGAYGVGAGVGGRYLQTIGLELDAIAARARQAALVSMPGKGDATAIPLLCADRLMVQGPAESNASITLRLQGAFDSLRLAGMPWGVLQQLLALFNGVAAGTPPMRTVTDNVVWDYYAAGASTLVPPTHFTSQTTAGQFNWDNHQEWTGVAPTQTTWWRYWLILDSSGPSAWCTTDGNWGDAGNWGDGGPWGINITAAGVANTPLFMQSMRSILRNGWQTAGAWCRWIVVNFTSGNYGPDAVNATPDGTWATWAKLVAGVWVQSRDQTARYGDGLLTGS